MPAPITFDVTCAAFPPGFAADPQGQAYATAERLTITPSEPWCAFTRGSVAPTSDIGPWLTDEGEWKTWSDEAGMYVPLVLDGGALKPASVALASLAAVTPKSVMVSDANGKPAALAGTAKQILQLDASGAPAFVSPQLVYFDVSLAGNQVYPSDESQNVVLFDTVQSQGGVAFDPVNHRVAAPAGSLWFVYCRLQIENVNNDAVQVQHNVFVDASGATAVGGLLNYSNVQPRTGVSVSGLLWCPTDTFLQAKISTVCNPSNLAGFQVAANSWNTRFGGYRLL